MARILLPTDFSANADHAAKYAAHLFGTEGHTFILLHAQGSIGYGDTLTGSFMADLMEAARQSLDQARVRFQEDHPGIRTEQFLVTGPLAPALRTFTRGIEADVIVMGMSGQGEARLFGSNTTAVLRASPAPVIAVPSDLAMRPVRRILLADDHQVVAENDLALVRELAVRQGAEVFVTHVLPEGAHGGVHWSKGIYELGLRNVSLRFVDAPGDDVAAALEEAAKRHAVDLIAVLHRQAAFLDLIFRSSVAKTLADITSYPLLVLQQKG